ncbi:MAG: helix-turn-helix transcriptional regulator [Gemmataceae bacterium]
MRFSEIVRSLREKAGLTQQQLAEKADIPIGTLRNHEQGQRLPSLAAARRLAAALGVTVDTLADCDELNQPKKPTAKKGKK